MRRSLCILGGLLAVLPAAHAQDTGGRSSRVLHDLALTQKRAADDLKEKLEDIRALAADLREQGEEAKADLLLAAVSIVTEKRIVIAEVPGRQILETLRTAIEEMARILEERPDATAEVQRIGERVLAALDEVVHTLTGQDDLDQLEKREEALREAGREVGEFVRKQQELRDRTQQSVDRTAAEDAAAKALRDIEELQREIDQLDRDARRELAEVDAARERAARMKDLLQRQQRLKNETAVRAGQTDKVTPRVNRALAELEALGREARRAEEESAAQGALAELAREVRDLAQRQARVAGEIEKRNALERAREMLGTGQPEDVRRALEEAAKQAEGADAEALRRAAAAPGREGARAEAARALRNALEKMASRETLARDEKTLVRDIERAVMNAPREDAGKLDEALVHARRAAQELGGGRDGAKDARAAAEALQEAADTLERKAAAQGDEAEQARRAAARAEAAKRADALAEELKKMAGDEDMRNAGLGGAVEDAERAAREAARELREAAEAAGERQPLRARDKARAARERMAKAADELEQGLKEGEDLVERQGRVAEELRSLADGAESADRKGRLQSAAAKAGQAKDQLAAGELGSAGRSQQEVLDQLEKLAREAEQRVAETAQRHRGALDRAEKATKQAANRAGEIAKDLEQGARSAKENDSRRRLETAAESVKKAEEDMRRSLRRLEDMLPKSAEQDRRDAQEELKKAKRDLQGLRESHDNVDEQARRQLQRIGEEQRALEEAVKRLEEQLKRQKENSGAERLQDAQSAMRDAAQRLEQGDVDEAERAQDRAEKSLKEAEKELNQEERRYRSLRQYELLFKLKEELTKFRRTAQGHRETLGDLAAKVRAAGRVTRLIRKEGITPLREQVDALARDVDEKAEAIGEEGAIVYTYMLKGCATDLKEVEAQLADREVGLVPQELLADVVRRFDLAIKGLERDLKEKQEEQQQGGQNRQGQQGEPSLVPPDAEIRMVMVLQKELNRERELFFENRPDFGRRAPTPGEKARLERLYHKQGSLAELFDGLREKLMRQGQDDEPEFPEEEQR